MDPIKLSIFLSLPVILAVLYLIARSIRFPGENGIPIGKNIQDAKHVFRLGGGLNGFNFSPGYLRIFVFEDGIILKPKLGRMSWMGRNQFALFEKKSGIVDRTNYSLKFRSDELLLGLTSAEADCLKALARDV